MGTILTTKPRNRSGYSKTKTKKRMNIGEQERSEVISSSPHGDTIVTTVPELRSKRSGKIIDHRYEWKTFNPFVMRTQGGRDIPKDVWDREKYWGTYDETRVVGKKYIKQKN